MTTEMTRYERFRAIYSVGGVPAPTPARIGRERALQGRERAVQTLKDMALNVLLILALLAGIILVGMIEGGMRAAGA